MGNALTNFMASTDIAELDEQQMGQALIDSADEGQTGDGAGTVYLNFSGKLGKYSLGKEKADMDPNALYVLEPQTCVKGFQCWKGQKPFDKFIWSIYKPDPITRDELPDHGPYRETAGEGWKFMLGFGVVSTDGEATQIQFSTDSVSGKNAVSALCREMGVRQMKGEPSIPVISFDREQFTAQEQTNWKPKFNVEAWVTRPAAAAFFGEVMDLDKLISGKQPTAAQLKKLAA